MTEIRWRGVFPALTTKFRADDRPDWDAMERHLAFQLDAGVHGLIVLGSPGENSTLGRDEKPDIVRLWELAEAGHWNEARALQEAPDSRPDLAEGAPVS